MTFLMRIKYSQKLPCLAWGWIKPKFQEDYTYSFWNVLPLNLLLHKKNLPIIFSVQLSLSGVFPWSTLERVLSLFIFQKTPKTQPVFCLSCLWILSHNETNNPLLITKGLSKTENWYKIPWFRRESWAREGSVRTACIIFYWKL